MEFDETKRKNGGRAGGGDEGIGGKTVVNALLYKIFSNPYQSRYYSISLYYQCQTGHDLPLPGTVNVLTRTQSYKLSMPQPRHDLINYQCLNSDTIL